MKKHITMTYIEVLEGMLQRKRETIKIVSAEVLSSPDSINKKKVY
jgi:hypothetical protein